MLVTPKEEEASAPSAPQDTTTNTKPSSKRRRGKLVTKSKEKEDSGKRGIHIRNNEMVQESPIMGT